MTTIVRTCLPAYTYWTQYRPLLGGTFSNPADKYPSLFDTALFRTYPYLLPSLTAASIAVCGATFGLFYLEEVN